MIYRAELWDFLLVSPSSSLESGFKQYFCAFKDCIESKYDWKFRETQEGGVGVVDDRCEL